jgi:hypothetical protein
MFARQLASKFAGYHAVRHIISFIFLMPSPYLIQSIQVGSAATPLHFILLFCVTGSWDTFQSISSYVQVEQLQLLLYCYHAMALTVDMDIKQRA